MRIEQVAARIDLIVEAAKRQDDSIAHQLEDNLHNDVLRSIADGSADDPRQLAAATLKSNDIEFSRWTE